MLVCFALHMYMDIYTYMCKNTHVTVGDLSKQAKQAVSLLALWGLYQERGFKRIFCLLILHWWVQFSESFQVPFYEHLLKFIGNYVVLSNILFFYCTFAIVMLLHTISYS